MSDYKCKLTNAKIDYDINNLTMFADITIKSDSDESEEEVKPVKAKKEIKALKKEVVKAPKKATVKAPVKAPKKEQVKPLVNSDSNIAVEIVDSMSK